MPTRPDDWIDPSTLSSAERAISEENWRMAQLVLTDLVTDLRLHRATGCADWTCPGPVSTLLARMEDMNIHLLLRAALERLALPLM